VLFKLSQPAVTDTEVSFHILSSEGVYEGYDYSINSHSSGDDVGANRVTIPAGESQAEFEIAIIDDYAGEMHEDLKILVETPLNDSFKIEEQLSTVTIEDNDLLYDMSLMLSYDVGDTFKSIDWPLDDTKVQFVTLSDYTGDSGGLAHVALDSDGVAVRTVIDTEVTSQFNNLGVMDLDSDGVDEVVVSQSFKTNDTWTNTLHLYEYWVDGFSSQVVEYTGLDRVRVIEGFDVNDDGSQDIVLGNYSNTKMLALLSSGHEDSETLDVSQWETLLIDDGSESSITYGYSNRINISYADSDVDGIKEILTSFASGEDGDGASFSYVYNPETTSFEVAKITDTGGRGSVCVDENDLISGVHLIFDSSGTVSYINDMGDVVEAWKSGRKWAYKVGIEDIQQDGDAEVVVATSNNFAVGSGEMKSFRTLEDLVTEESYIPLSSKIFAYEIIEEDDATDSSIAILGTSRGNLGLWLLSATDRETAGKTYEQTTLDISDLSTFPTLSISDVVVSEASKTADIFLTLDKSVNIPLAVIQPWLVWILCLYKVKQCLKQGKQVTQFQCH